MASTTSKIAWGIITIIVVALLAVGWFGYTRILQPNVPSSLENEIIQIPRGLSYDQYVDLLVENDLLNNRSTFEWTAKQMKFDQRTPRSGQFRIPAGASNLELIRHLRSAAQEPVKYTINSKRLLSDIAAANAEQLEADSAAFMAAFTDQELLNELDLTPETVIAAIIPNTYNLFWNISPEAYLKRMVKERDAFWKKNGRLEKAKKLNMTPTQVTTLASIVQKETNYNPEKRRMAGVYYNRFLGKQGIRKLQADPTVVFAVGDFSLRRVLNVHLETDSPYNTYMYEGLPPGPIAQPDIYTIDATLELETHDYMYFCAAPNHSGSHLFARNLNQHNVNAKKYRRWRYSPEYERSLQD